MRINETSKGVRVKRAELLETIQKNRSEHRSTFEKAQVGYRKAVIEELDRMLAEAKAGKKIRRSVELMEPMDMTEAYDTIIKMLQMSVDDVVMLDTQEFQNYVMDQWNWKSQFTTSNAAYLHD